MLFAHSTRRALTCLVVTLLLFGVAQKETVLGRNRTLAAGQFVRSAKPLAASAAHTVDASYRCAAGAVFVRLDTEIRGYPLGASGVTQPCTIIGGSLTQLNERGAIVVTYQGYLHSLSFQSDGFNALTIFGWNAAGNIPPTRMLGVDQDHVALAVDSRLNDFVIASEGYEGQNCWYVVPPSARRATGMNCDDRLTAIHALATNKNDELFVAGTEAGTGAGRVDVYDAPATAASHRVRSIVGPATGLLGLWGTSGYFGASFSLATDPLSGALYVYDSAYNYINSKGNPAAPFPRILEYAPLATGNVSPLRVISGPSANLTKDAFSVDVIGLDTAGEVFALNARPYVSVSVFSSGQHSNAAPRRTFTDPTAPIGIGGAALAIRSVL